MASEVNAGGDVIISQQLFEVSILRRTFAHLQGACSDWNIENCLRYTPRERERETDRQTDGHTDRQTDRKTDREQKETEKDRETETGEGERDKTETERHLDPTSLALLTFYLTKHHVLEASL